MAVRDAVPAQLLNDEPEDLYRPFESKSNKLWKQIYNVIYNKQQPIPVVKMCLKAKQLDVNYKEMHENFYRGRPTS